MCNSLGKFHLRTSKGREIVSWSKQNNDADNYLPIIGNESELSGRSSESENMSTEKARNTVIPKDTFSPDSGGNQNMSNAIRERTKDGMIMYIVW